MIAWILLRLTSTLFLLYALDGLAPAPAPAFLRRVLLIAPAKNGGPSFKVFLESLKAQFYTSARVVVVVESEADSSYEIARACGEGPGLPVSVLVAGRSENAGQKVWNLLAALKTLDSSDEIVAFVDADTLPDRDWLLRLVLPILQRRAEVVSGFRWLVPHGDRWGGYGIAAANNAIATLPRTRFLNLAWGGSTAIERSALDRIGIGAWWQGAVSDDLQLTRALWSHGLKVVCPPGLIVRSPIACSVAEGLEFGRRQYVLVRTHLPAYWALSAVLILAPLTMLVLTLVAAIRGDGAAVATLAIIFALAQIRFVLHARIERWILRDGALAAFRPTGFKSWAAALTHPAMHALVILSALSSRRIRWTGIDYEILAPQRVLRSRDD